MLSRHVYVRFLDQHCSLLMGYLVESVDRIGLIFKLEEWYSRFIYGTYKLGCKLSVVSSNDQGVFTTRELKRIFGIAY